MSEWQSVQHYTREEVQATFDWALQQHASSLNLKSRPIPAEYRDIVDKALLQIGYRFRVNKLAFETPVKAGKPLAVSVTWRNDGVAPAYLFYPVQWRVVNAAGATVTQLKTRMTCAAGCREICKALSLWRSPPRYPPAITRCRPPLPMPVASRGCCWLTKAKPPTAGIN